MPIAPPVPSRNKGLVDEFEEMKKKEFEDYLKKMNPYVKKFKEDIKKKREELESKTN